MKTNFRITKLFSHNHRFTFLSMLIFEIIIGVLDYWVGDFATLSLIYIVPVVITSYIVGKKQGVIVAIFAVLVWNLVDYKLDLFSDGIFYVGGEIISRLIIIVAFALIISANASTTKKLKDLAFKDAKTDALNYRAFLEFVHEKKALSDRLKLNSYIAYFDMDKFKEVNDKLGHSAGDLVLKQFSHLSQHNMRSYDIFARIGGDEFVAFFMDKDNESIELILNRISLAFNQVMKEQGLKVTVSYGYVLFDGDFSNVEKYIHLADMNMYEAKSRKLDVINEKSNNF